MPSIHKTMNNFSRKLSNRNHRPTLDRSRFTEHLDDEDGITAEHPPAHPAQPRQVFLAARSSSLPVKLIENKNFTKGPARKFLARMAKGMKERHTKSSSPADEVGCGADEFLAWADGQMRTSSDPVFMEIGRGNPPCPLIPRNNTRKDTNSSPQISHARTHGLESWHHRTRSRVDGLSDSYYRPSSLTYCAYPSSDVLPLPP